MNATKDARRSLPRIRWVFTTLLSASILCGASAAQDAARPPAAPANPDSAIAGDQSSPAQDLPAENLPAKSTPAQRADQAWTILTDAAADTKHPQTRIQALAAVGLLRTPHSARLIEAAMHDPDLDVRTAAALAAGQSGDRNLSTPLRELLDDSEPQVVFAAAMSLWKMNDRSGEDILMAIADGERSANPTMVHGARHKIDSDLHDPGKMARLGATEGASMLLGPFGFGIAAFNFIHQSGGDLARASAIEAIAQERTPPVHQELLAALSDKDPAVRAAAAKGLVDYRDKPTSSALYALFTDPKYPVRLTAAAAYLRTTGTPGPTAASSARSATHPTAAH